MKTTGSVRGITFDLDGVYFPNGKANFIKALEGLGVSETEAKRVFLKTPEMNNLYKLGKITDEEYWSFAVKEWQLENPWQELVTLMVESYAVDEKVATVVKNLRLKGYKTLVCSNNFPARVNGLQSKFAFLDDFDAAVFSFEVGAPKPEKRIFEELAKKSGLKPEEIVFADDDPEKLSGAKELGVKTFVFENFNQFLAELRKLGVEI